MVTFLENPGLRVRYVVPACDLRAPDWPRKSASLATDCLFQCKSSPAGDVDHLFYAVDGHTYGVCVETMTKKTNKNTNIIVPFYRLAKGELACKKIILAVYAVKDIRGLDCTIAGWLDEAEVRRWEAPIDKTMFKRRGKRFAVIPPERLKPVDSLFRLAEQWRCAI